MVTIMDLHKYIYDLVDIIKNKLEFAPSLFVIPAIITGLSKGKYELIFNFILIYIIFEAIMYFIHRKLARVQEKDASKVIRVFELNKKGLAIHQIAEILETEGYRSIRGRKTLEKSIAKIIENGNLTKALELKKMGFTELSHKISRNSFSLIFRSIIIISFVLFIIPPDAKLTIKNITPDPLGPQEIGCDVKWKAVLDNEKNIKYNWALYVDDDREDHGGGRGTSFYCKWDTSEEKFGKRIITVKVWCEGNSDCDAEWTGDYELFNQKPNINKDINPYYYSQDRNKIFSSRATKGTIVHFDVDADDPDEDELYYEFMVDGSVVQGASERSYWKWDTSNNKEKDYTISVTVTDGQNHINTLGVTTNLNYEVIALIPKMKYNDIGELEISVPEEVVISRKKEGKPPMQYRFYLNGEPLTSWQESRTYKWNIENYTKGDYTISGKMRFDERSRDEYDAETPIEKVQLN